MYLFRNIIRLVVLLSGLCLAFFFILDGCGGMSGGDEDFEDRDFRNNRDRRDRGRDRNRVRGGDEDLREEDGLDENDEDGGFRGFDKSAGRWGGDDFGDDQEAVPASQIIEPLEQSSLSEKIDFLFILDTSLSNRKFIEKSVLQKKLGTFIPRLNDEGIDWRIFTTCGHTDKDKPIYDGRLHEMEHNGTLINFLYLDNHILDSYNARDPLAFVSEVFIDTISHPKRVHCSRPPFCHRNTENRPLKALSGFLNTASRHQILRDDADMLVIIISNQDERPSKTKPKKPYDPRKITDQFEQIFPDKNLFAINFVVKSTDASCKKGKAAVFIPQLGILTNGLTESICSNNYTHTIIEFIREKQGKAVRRHRPVSTKKAEEPENLRNYIYGENLDLR